MTELPPTWVQCDAPQHISVDTAFGEAVAALGGPDAQVHAAGLCGTIINFGSSEGVMGNPMSAIHAAPKAAVASWA